jgi:hypothetical protein
MGLSGLLAGLRRLCWRREELTVLCAARDTLIRGGEAVAPHASFTVGRGDLRALAVLAVDSGGLVDLEDLRLAHTALRSADRIFVAHEGGRPVGAAWIGNRETLDLLPAPAPTTSIELGGAAAVLQFVGNAWPRPDGGGLRVLLAAMVAESEVDAVWLACPSDALAHLQALQQMGFQPRYRAGATVLAGGRWQGWCRVLLKPTQEARREAEGR